MTRKEAERSPHNFFELYPANHSLAQYLQDISSGRFERTSGEPEGSIWGTYKVVSSNKCPRTRFDEDNIWINMRNGHRARLESQKSSAGLAKSACAPDYPPLFVPHSLSTGMFFGTGAVRGMTSTGHHSSQGMRTPQQAPVLSHSGMSSTESHPESTFCSAACPLRNPLATGIKRIIYNTEKTYDCERRLAYNRLFEDFVADTTPVSLTESDCFYDTTNRSSESGNFIQGTNDLTNVTTETELRQHEFSFDCQPSTVASSMTSLQSDPSMSSLQSDSDPSSTLELSDAEESTSYIRSLAQRNNVPGTNSVKDCDAREFSLTRPMNAVSLENSRRFHLREMCKRPAYRDDSVAFNMYRRFPCKASIPGLNFSTSSLSSNPEFQNHPFYSLNEDE